MEGEHEIVEGDQEIVEEIVDEGEVYEDTHGYGEEEEELFLDANSLDVDGLPPGEYIQLPNGQLIPADGGQPIASSSLQQERSVQQMRPQQHRRPIQNENSASHSMNQVYAIRGNQVFRVDKNTQRIVNTKVEMKAIPKTEMDANMPSSSTSAYGGNNANRYQAYRRDPNFGLNITASQKPKKKVVTGHRKPCNCTKSMCLKLYCECFANGEFCRDCNCKDCHNNLANETERTRAIKSSLERNPNAFKPKIVCTGSKGKTDAERLHMKGCHCKKSNCLKNYCECYEAKVACTERCKCCGCKNTEGDRQSKYRDRIGPAALLSLANVASLSDTRHATPFSDDESEGEVEEKRDPKTMPWFYLTDEVVEASTLCLVAQAEQMERENEEVADDLMERILMSEFSNCLQSIISSATETAAAAKAAKATNRLQRTAVHTPPPDLTSVTGAFDS